MKIINVEKVLWSSGTFVVAALVAIFTVAHHLNLWATVPLPASPLRIISDRVMPVQKASVEVIVPVTKQVPPEKKSYELANKTTGIAAQNHQIMLAAARQTGVDWQVLTSLFFTESTNGRNLGSHDPQSVMSAKEYQAFVEICRAIGKDPAAVKVGGCGELGPFQFMPTTWQEVGVDADGDGIKNPFSVHDASVSAGKYLIYRGYQQDPEKAIRRYKGGSKGKPLADRVVDQTMTLALAMGMAS